MEEKKKMILLKKKKRKWRVSDEIKKQVKKYLDTNDSENLWDLKKKKSPKMEVHNDTDLPEINKLSCELKELGKEIQRLKSAKLRK